MKAIRIKMTGNGMDYVWTVKGFERAWTCGGNLKRAKLISGWSFTDHEGYERFSEGNWLAMVDKFRLVAGNYGLQTNIS